MPILSADIKLLASRIMDDGDEGGGGPSAHAIPYGTSNGVYLDVTEADRAGGNVSVRQLHMAVMTPNAEQFMGASIILALPPTDPNVSITLAKCDLFHRRSDIARAIANYLIEGTQWSGYLLEDHVQGMMKIQILHRPGTPAPNIGRTLVLTANVGQPGEKIEFVRVTRTETTERTFTYQENTSYVDFQASVTQCDLSDRLRNSFPGSPPSRSFGPAAGKTTIRDTTVADAATYYGAAPTLAATPLEATSVKVASIWSQLVPSSRTESIALDQRPASQRPLQLATAPRNVSVSVAPHSRRIKVGQENRSFSWVAQLRPLPAPNTLTISFRALGNWYELMDDGAGGFTGAGVGTVNYLTGSTGFTLPSLPDVGSAIVFSWGEKTAFTNRSGNVGFRAPEFAFQLDHSNFKPGSLVASWPSGGVIKTATDNGTGGFTGRAVGELNYASSQVFIRPLDMLDAGGEIQLVYEHSTVITKNVTGVTPDAGGFVTIALDDVPAARSVAVEWVTVRNVSGTSGASSSGTSAEKSNGTTITTDIISTPNPDYRPPALKTRIFAGLAKEGLVDKMVPCGTRTATGETVYTAIQPTLDAKGWGYTVPDDYAAMAWDEIDWGNKFKSTGGAAAPLVWVWGYRASSQPLGLA